MSDEHVPELVPGPTVMTFFPLSHISPERGLARIDENVDLVHYER